MADGFLCVGAYALERWLGLNCFSFSLSLGKVAAGAPVVVDVFIPSAMPVPPIYRYPQRLVVCVCTITTITRQSINYLFQIVYSQEEDLDAPF